MKKKLQTKCWDLIDLQTSEAIASDAFSYMHQETLTELLKRELLNVKEVDLFKAVLKWSEAECLRKEIESNPMNKRAVMGKAIYQIRFASMTQHEFGRDVDPTGILTPEEMVVFYAKFSGVEKTSELWNMSERRAGEEFLLRCCRFDRYGFSFMGGALGMLFSSEHAVCVSFDKPVKIKGVRLLGDCGKEYDAKLQVFSQLIEKKCLSQKNSRGFSGFDVMLPTPIEVQANVVVHLKATISGRGSESFGLGGKNTVETNSVIINFSNPPDADSGETSVERGQFDEIIFSEIIT